MIHATSLYGIRCPLCGWPMCSEACSGSVTHQPECRLTRQRGSPINLEIKSSTKAFPLYETVAILRCMSLKTTDPDKYKGIMELESHKEERKRSGRSVKTKFNSDEIPNLSLKKMYF